MIRGNAALRSPRCEPAEVFLFGQAWPRSECESPNSFFSFLIRQRRQQEVHPQTWCTDSTLAGVTIAEEEGQEEEMMRTTSRHTPGTTQRMWL